MPIGQDAFLGLSTIRDMNMQAEKMRQAGIYEQMMQEQKKKDDLAKLVKEYELRGTELEKQNDIKSPMVQYKLLQDDKNKLLQVATLVTNPEAQRAILDKVQDRENQMGELMRAMPSKQNSQVPQAQATPRYDQSRVNNVVDELENQWGKIGTPGYKPTMDNVKPVVPMVPPTAPQASVTPSGGIPTWTPKTTLTADQKNYKASKEDPEYAAFLKNKDRGGTGLQKLAAMRTLGKEYADTQEEAAKVTDELVRINTTKQLEQAPKDRLTAAINVGNRVDYLVNKIDKDGDKITGPIDSRINKLKKFFVDDEDTRDATEFEARMVDVLAQYVLGKSGATVTDAERAALTRVIGESDWQPGNLKNNLLTLKRVSIEDAHNMLDVEAGSNRDVSKLRGLLPPRASSAGKSGQSAKNPDVQAYADQYKMTYDQAESLLRKRGAIK